LGVELGLDGLLTVAPVVPAEFWERGFGQRLEWRGRALDYQMRSDRLSGTYTGDGTQRVTVRWRRGNTTSRTLSESGHFEIRQAR